MPLYDQVNDLLRVVEIVLQLSTKESSNGTKSGNNLYPKVIKCVGVTLDSALLYRSVTSSDRVWRGSPKLTKFQEVSIDEQ